MSLSESDATIRELAAEVERLAGCLFANIDRAAREKHADAARALLSRLGLEGRS